MSEFDLESIILDCAKQKDIPIIKEYQFHSSEGVNICLDLFIPIIPPIIFEIKSNHNANRKLQLKKYRDELGPTTKMVFFTVKKGSKNRIESDDFFYNIILMTRKKLLRKPY